MNDELGNGYTCPSIELLRKSDSVPEEGRQDMERGVKLFEIFDSFGLHPRLIGIVHSPAMTRFELQFEPGVQVSKIVKLERDIALHMAVYPLRILAPIPGKAAVGVEIPNNKVETVRLRDVLESSEAQKRSGKIVVGLGMDDSGQYAVADIAKMPHVLVAGQTGSGKSACLNAFIISMLLRASPKEVKLILIDTKYVELRVYNDIPHLMCPVIADARKASRVLEWAVAEMMKRYKLFASCGAHDFEEYNAVQPFDESRMPRIVIVIDGLADLMMETPNEVEDSILRLTLKGQACGIHMVMSTRCPRANVISSIIKANISTRIAFSVASRTDSRIIIDRDGAEQLRGNGDMLFAYKGMPLRRIQGAWVSDEEIHAVVSCLRREYSAFYDEDMLEHLTNASYIETPGEECEYDPKLAEAVEEALDMGETSISILVRRMRIGYARAGRLIDEMCRRGIISEADGAKPRSVLITREQYEQMFEAQ